MAKRERVTVYGGLGEAVRLKSGAYTLVVVDQPLGYLRLRLVDAGQDPMVGVPYQVSNKSGAFRFEGHTDAAGQVSHGPVPFDDYDITVAGCDAVVAPVGPADGYQQTRLAVVGLGYLHVVVRQADGRPISGASYRIQDTDGAARFAGKTADDGTLRHEHAPFADYLLEIHGKQVTVAPVPDPDVAYPVYLPG